MISFRNVLADPEDPVETWPYEALVIAIERGTLTDWTKIIRSIEADPWGLVARQVEDYLAYEHPYGVAGLLDRAVARSRREAEARERTEVAAEVADLIETSGLTTGELATAVGTSRTRLSTYRSGRVTPSAAFLVRLRRTVDRVRQHH